MSELTYEERVVGSILGGACGDALGYPWEFARSETMRRREPVTEYRDGTGYISDDTQMTLFTMQAAPFGKERQLRRQLSKVYWDWYQTQTQAEPASDAQGLAREQWLYQTRAPGETCMGSLSTIRKRGQEPKAVALSKGCGAVMRAAPFGLVPFYAEGRGNPARRWFAAVATAYRRAYVGGTLTHGSNTAGESAGMLAGTIQGVVQGLPLSFAITQARHLLTRGGETDRAVDRAWISSLQRGPSQQVLEEENGEGWVADEALGIALYAALCYPDEPEQAISLAVSHGGDSDSTGAICGNIVGALNGTAALPWRWVRELEHGHDIQRLAEEFARKNS